jgi:hypothetical protein
MSIGFRLPEILAPRCSLDFGDMITTMYLYSLIMDLVYNELHKPEMNRNISSFSLVVGLLKFVIFQCEYNNVLCGIYPYSYSSIFDIYTIQ